MAIDKRQRFENSASYFACPICQEPLDKVDNSLKCANNHTYDLSKFGYVNLLGGKKVDDHYSKASFENRKLILENGFYDHILKAVEEAVSQYPEAKTLLDIGCGEGFSCKTLTRRFCLLISPKIQFRLRQKATALTAESGSCRI